jgi:hypothetical protein
MLKSTSKKKCLRQLLFRPDILNILSKKAIEDAERRSYNEI